MCMERACSRAADRLASSDCRRDGTVLFEMTFHVQAVPNALVDELIDEFDATAGTDHTGHDFVTVVGKGRTFEDAARAAVTELQVKGLCIIRLVPDLVTRSEIAERLG